MRILETEDTSENWPSPENDFFELKIGSQKLTDVASIVVNAFDPITKEAEVGRSL